MTNNCPYKTMKEKPLKKVEIDIKLLEKIADYYEFPMAVFFGNLKVFPKNITKRSQIFKLKAKKYDELKEVFDD